ncbi:exported hypothetical protein [Arthrobacter sp. 9AX]|nr:exported hypothetical protein [Arthrobacter sp. 9AX]
MVSLISLSALIEPQNLKAAVHSPRNIEATDLPKLSDLYLLAYGDGIPSGQRKGRRQVQCRHRRRPRDPHPASFLINC